MDYSNQRKLGALLSYFTLGFNILIGMVYTPFVISKLGSVQYGVYNLANSLISFITLLDLGLGQTIVRYITKARICENKEEESRLNGLFLKTYSAISLVALILGVAIIILYPAVAKQSLSKEEISLFRAVYSILVINVVISFPLSIFSATLNAYEEFFSLRMIELIANILKYAALFILLFNGYKLVAIATVTLVFSVLMHLAHVYLCISRTNIKISFAPTEKKLSREIFAFSFFIFLNMIIDFLYVSTDKMILGAVSGAIAVSVYSIGVYFSRYFSELSTALSGVFMPKIMGMYQRNEKQEISDTFNRVGRLQMALLFLVLGGYICLGREFLLLWVGPDFSESYWIGIIIMVPSIIPLTQNIGITILRVMNQHKYRSYMYLVIAIINVIISIPLAMRMGGVGSAIGTAIGNILGQIIFMNWFYSKKVGIQIRNYWINILKFSILTFVVVSIVWFFKTRFMNLGWISLFIFIVAFSVLYTGLYFCFVADSYEKSFVKSIINKIVKRG